MERVLSFRADCFADDVAVTEEMTAWTDAQLIAFFESGGQTLPTVVNASCATGAEALPPPKLPLRFLSLHGGGTSANVNKMQMSRMLKALKDKLGTSSIECDFLQGTREWKGSKDPMLERMFPGEPFFGWYGVEHGAKADSGPEYVDALLDPNVSFTYIDHEKALDALDEQIERHGPYDGLIGFSQGAIVITMGTARRLERAAKGLGPPPTWRVNVLMSALAPRGAPYACMMPEPATPLQRRRRRNWACRAQAKFQLRRLRTRRRRGFSLPLQAL